MEKWFKQIRCIRMWFDDISRSENPGRNELKQFVRDVRSFLFFILEDEKERFSFLWHYHPELQDLALETMKLDIANGVGLELDQVISKISDDSLRSHGLEGHPLKFKFNVLSSIANKWETVILVNSIREWLKIVVDAIDAILASLIDAAGGAGGLIKEFKDTLASLA